MFYISDPRRCLKHPHNFHFSYFTNKHLHNMRLPTELDSIAIFLLKKKTEIVFETTIHNFEYCYNEGKKVYHRQLSRVYKCFAFIRICIIGHTTHKYSGFRC